MDADGNLIPIVEGDQGEGHKDPYEDYMAKSLEEAIQESDREFKKEVNASRKRSMHQERNIINKGRLH